MFGGTVLLLLRFVAAFLLLLLLAPLAVCLAVLIAIRTRRSPIFGQERIGQYNRVFTIYKFRTMTDLCDGSGRLLADEQRLMPLGRFLRNTSLDELPQLWNIMRGDMAFVGPRPLLPKYMPYYNATQLRRHEVKPGVTGWTSVHGRNALSWEKKFELDVWYVDHHNLWLDVTILWMTARKVICREGISYEGHATMPEFTGNETHTETAK